MLMEDRWYQSEAEQSVFDYFTLGGRGNPVVGMPTGTGKSWVIARINYRVLNQYPGQRILNLTHVKELIEQNSSKLRSLWPSAPMGIYSAGLKQRDTALPIIYGGIQSVIKCEELLSRWWDLVFVDEAHMISPSDATMYMALIARLRAINPYVKVVGFSATLFRMGMGGITDGGIFTDVCYDLTGPVQFNRLIAEGWISPPIPKRMRTQLDVSKVGRGQDGDYRKGELERAVDKDDITFGALTEVCEQSYGRQSWMTFCAGKDHSEHVAKMLNEVFNVPTRAIHSGMSAGQIDENFRLFKTGQIRCITGMNKFTTGFDHPPVDLIVMLRPTQSSVLWVQMLGRGTRPYDPMLDGILAPFFPIRKQNCLVLDFAGNTARLGPINDPMKPRPPGGGGGGGAPVKVCSVCGTYNPTSVRMCVFCGADFLIMPQIVPEASTEELVRTDAAITETFNVERVIVVKHAKSGKVPTLRVTYSCGGLNRFEEYVCIEHPYDSYANRKAREWWRNRCNEDPPLTVDEALTRLASLKSPRRVKVWVNKQYPEITSYEF